MHPNQPSKPLKLVITCLLLTFSLSLPVMAENTNASDYQFKLEEIREKIEGLLSKLNSTETQRSNVRDELQKLERKIAKTSRSLRQTRRKHTKTSNKLKKLQIELAALKTKLSQQRDLLAKQVKSAYTIGKQPQLKLLLNQQEPGEMGRAMVYFDYLNRARSQQINDFLLSIEEKQRLEASISETALKLEKLARTQANDKQQLALNRSSRKQLLEKLNKDIDHQQMTLDELKGSRDRIEELLMSLGELLADIPNEPVEQQPFDQLKGKLPWPIKGPFSARFGTVRDQSDLTWNGVIIDAAYNTPVRAISYGRVAFADWLQGYGFITIIDHNDGFMSLYGHNQELYKQAGDWVESGEVIAAVGDSGGQEASGLYFELRSQGKPIDPGQWCSSKAQHLALQDK
ncbi:MAG: peptidoglycan DD-metalloendopeptidase family protein [Gammaproteobacteria bacterium]|nr:peptidoglycan DD-metalloendopeptidase family protein [Gammaproteobacteria bacterium]